MIKVRIVIRIMFLYYNIITIIFILIFILFIIIIFIIITIGDWVLLLPWKITLIIMIVVCAGCSIFSLCYYYYHETVTKSTEESNIWDFGKPIDYSNNNTNNNNRSMELTMDPTMINQTNPIQQQQQQVGGYSHYFFRRSNNNNNSNRNSNNTLSSSSKLQQPNNKFTPDLNSL
jgi:energy-coupling factor transporter transmembrane protein EcfT